MPIDYYPCQFLVASDQIRRPANSKWKHVCRNWYPRQITNRPWICFHCPSQPKASARQHWVSGCRFCYFIDTRWQCEFEAEHIDLNSIYLLFSCTENVEIRQVFETQVVEKGGEEYLEIKNVRVQLTVSKLTIQFNSRTGNEAINDTVNKVVNENWKDIYYELKPDLEKNIGDVIKSLVKPMFGDIPYKDFFLP